MTVCLTNPADVAENGADMENAEESGMDEEDE